VYNIGISVFFFFRRFLGYGVILILLSSYLNLLTNYSDDRSQQALFFQKTGSLSRDQKKLAAREIPGQLRKRLKLRMVAVLLPSILDEKRTDREDSGGSFWAGPKITGITILLYALKYFIWLLILGKMALVFERFNNVDLREQTKYSSHYTMSDILYYLKGKKLQIVSLLFLMDLLMRFTLTAFYEHYLFLNMTRETGAGGFAVLLTRYLSYHLMGLSLNILFLFTLASAFLHNYTFFSSFKHGVIVLLQYPRDNILPLVLLFAAWVFSPGVFYLFPIDLIDHGANGLADYTISLVYLNTVKTSLTLISIGAVFQLIYGNRFKKTSKN